ncbi:Dynein light chain roadblock-type 2 [Halocaridina rubra]|uniref:Dynein light chain roadblock-type 2 n=1 Tax=Halocaridina rubra TaxID=373956 RepID=A0AAN9AEU0_HALRR
MGFWICHLPYFLHLTDKKLSVQFYFWQSAEVEETLKRIQSHKGVVGVIVVNSEGIPIKSTLDNPTTIQYTGLISGLTDKARSVVRDLDPTNDLTFLRVRSKKHEIMIAPDKEYMLIVVQNTSE